MKLSGLIAAAAFAMVPIVTATPAAAQDWDELDRQFLACKAVFIAYGFGNDDQATAYCYAAIYGNEGGGGGGSPGPFHPCDINPAACGFD